MTVLITGANRGIGRGLYDHYRDLGMDVIGTSRAGQAPFAQLDVCDASSLRALALDHAGVPIDLLVCNAGVYLDKLQSLGDGYPPEMWAATFAANTTGVFQTIQTLLPNLRAAKSTRIAIISSNMASQTRAPGGSYIYRASKAAVLNIGRNLAKDLAPENIAVGIYHPGWVRTDMGGQEADISLAQSVTGLARQFQDLNLSKTGCFEGWDGRQLQF